MGKKNKRKYNCYIDNGFHLDQQPMSNSSNSDYAPLIRYDDNGVFFGMPKNSTNAEYVGMKQGTEGHILLVGGSGRGKSSGIIMPTLATWGSTFFALDVKGELFETYEKLYESGIVSRKCFVFDPMQPDTISYDPFWLLDNESADFHFNSVMEIAYALIPPEPSTSDPFWINGERDIFGAALHYGYKLGLGFSETLCMILQTPLRELITTLTKSRDPIIAAIIGGLAEAKPEMIASIERGIRNKVTTLVADSHLCHAFRGQREGAACFNWGDLDEYNIFFKIPAERIELWSGAVNLVLTQLIRHLERRPDKYSVTESPIQTLLIFDEFARFGKLELITSSLSTLRSKNVGICIAVQSIAQLDRIYGVDSRRIICDNCDFTVILGANDTNTQRYFAERIGTVEQWRTLESIHYDEDMWPTGSSEQQSFSREWRIFPHQFSLLEDVILLSPDGTFWVNKLRPLAESPEPVIDSIKKVLSLKNNTEQTIPVIRATAVTMVRDDHISWSDYPYVDKNGVLHLIGTSRTIESSIASNNKDGGILTMKERCLNTQEKVSNIQHEERKAIRAAREAAEKANSRRCYIIGELVVKHFPELLALNPGTAEENKVTFHSLDLFFQYLAEDSESVEKIAKKADCSLLFNCTGPLTHSIRKENFYVELPS